MDNACFWRGTEKEDEISAGTERKIQREAGAAAIFVLRPELITKAASPGREACTHLGIQGIQIIPYNSAKPEPRE